MTLRVLTITEDSTIAREVVEALGSVHILSSGPKAQASTAKAR